MMLRREPNKKNELASRCRANRIKDKSKYHTAPDLEGVSELPKKSTTER
jgi:hypothetical protein